MAHRSPHRPAWPITAPRSTNGRIIRRPSRDTSGRWQRQHPREVQHREACVGKAPGRSYIGPRSRRHEDRRWSKRRKRRRRRHAPSHQSFVKSVRPSNDRGDPRAAEGRPSGPARCYTAPSSLRSPTRRRPPTGCARSHTLTAQSLRRSGATSLDESRPPATSPLLTDGGRGGVPATCARAGGFTSARLRRRCRCDRRERSHSRSKPATGSCWEHSRRSGSPDPSVVSQK